MSKHLEIGKKGEQIAIAYLEKKGYTILQANYRVRFMELDIIAVDNEVLVIVEVKTRQSTYLAGPEDTVSRSKQKRLIKAANSFIVDFDIDLETRFDIISIILNNNQTKIDHIEDAFYPI